MNYVDFMSYRLSVEETVDVFSEFFEYYTFSYDSKYSVYTLTAYRDGIAWVASSASYEQCFKDVVMSWAFSVQESWHSKQAA